MTADRTHVFYTDASNGWAVTLLDENEYQVGEAEYLYRKSDAVKAAHGHGLDVHVFGHNGLLQRTITTH